MDTQGVELNLVAFFMKVINNKTFEFYEHEDSLLCLVTSENKTDWYISALPKAYLQHFTFSNFINYTENNDYLYLDCASPVMFIFKKIKKYNSF